MLKIAEILRDWDRTLLRIATLESRVKEREEANLDVVSALEAMADELARMRESLRPPDPETPQTKRTVRRASSWREFAGAARTASEKHLLETTPRQ